MIRVGPLAPSRMEMLGHCAGRNPPVAEGGNLGHCAGRNPPVAEGGILGHCEGRNPPVAEGRDGPTPAAVSERCMGL